MRAIRPLAAAILIVAPSAGAQQERAVFLSRVGTDTLAVEVMTRDGRAAAIRASGQRFSKTGVTTP